MGASFLVADDEPGIRDILKWELESLGHEVVLVCDGSAAVARVQKSEFDVVISDVRMPGLGGIDVLKATKEVAPDTEVIIVTGFADLDAAVECVRGGAFDLVQKPFDVNGLLSIISRALEHRHLRATHVLYETSQAILANQEPQRLPQLVVDMAMKVMVADDVSLMIPDASNRLHVAYSNGLSSSVRAEVQIPLGERVAGRVAVDRKPVLIPNGLDSDSTFHDVPSYRRVRSSIVYPLVAGDRLVGVLNINRTVNLRPFRQQDLERAATVASQALLALENGRLIGQMVASERLASVGQLAAGVAHEINNPVTYVLANHDYLGEKVDTLLRMGALIDQGADITMLRENWERAGGQTFLADFRQVLGEAEDGATRIRDIVRDLRALGRRNDDKHVPVDLNEAVRSALRIAGAELRSRSNVVTRLGDGVQVIGSAGCLSQVFINLLVNASQAVGSQSGGKRDIVVTTGREGDRVIASVSDTGPGILPENLPRIFEAFFTTKDPTAGTGLGLWISHEIIRNHGGEMHVGSPPGGGATFTVVLPTPGGSLATLAGR
ncbi:MAG: hypothetical protein A2289_07840 [Deltaproteobacteria bacterium RIFOXYA12_FULL_58_15]|nr:MAG: hypothetical protein A2289_07840 [Deltaproteobacteria bacterium RIFOXYA12_FULL_58_15]OGR13244.1 MAG: hypothetical protein A2341_15350 [Deltaproteobacteria bacterium RIFOXYB12_FULL_58_9]